jgi:phosphoglycolate phosphatase-like HAD superfamily hydrolase
MLGLVSVAIEGTARAKLGPANLNRFFIFGAFGSDSPDRAELTETAIQKATRQHSELTPRQVCVVGDTPHDIEAAKAAGAVSIGVATASTRRKNCPLPAETTSSKSLQDPFRTGANVRRPRGVGGVNPRKLGVFFSRSDV